jgi:methylglutaconyl-CoA hydratase
MAYNTLKLDFNGTLATITLNRPEKRNALSFEMVAELQSALAEVEANPARVVIFTGAGKSFCSGMDLESLKDLAAQSPAQNLEDSRKLATMFRRIWSFPKPTIAAVNGAAMAGGCGIATECDFTIAAPEAKFGFTEVRIGFIPAIVSVFLSRQIGDKHARDLLFTGRIIDAAEAHRIGLISQVVPADQLIATAQMLAASLTAVSPTSVVKTKRLLYEYTYAEIDRELELAVTANAKIRETADFREGISSFLEKRPPKWTGA